MTLLEKFDTVTLNTTDLIPADDKDWCEREQKWFEEAIKDLEVKQAYYQMLYETENNSCVIRGESYNTAYKRWNYRNGGDFKEEKGDNFYDTFKFSAAYPLKYIHELLQKCRESFVKNITDYFIKKYALEVPDFSLGQNTLLERCNYTVILELIKEHLGGVLDFVGSAIEQTVIQFKEEFKYKEISQTNNIVEFKRYKYNSRGENHHYPKNYDYDYKYFVLLDKAIAIFEREEVKENFAIMYLSGKDYGEWDTVLNCEMLEEIKMFKNGKLQLKFKEAFHASKFMSRFELNKI